MRSHAEYAVVKKLLAKGLNDCAVERATGIPRTTVRDWRRSAERKPSRACPACGHPVHNFGTLPIEAYAYLLGMYLGDGHVSRSRRTWRLRISLDIAWPNIMSECADALRAVFPANRVLLYRPDPNKRCAVASVYSNQIVCLFPQHGPGRKHLRSIELTDWQQDIVEDAPHQFLRGLIHSDGCRSINAIRGSNTTYFCPRYTFSNRSADIRALFTSTCDELGIESRRMNRWNISVARRDSVAHMDEFIGPKS